MTMTSQPRKLQPVAFALRPDILQSQLTLWALPFPSSWRAALTLLEQERTNREGREVSLPIRPLNDLVTALFSQLMTVPGMARAEQEDKPAPPWLLAHEPIAPESIVRLVRGWCWEMFAACPSFQVVLPLVKADDLAWTQITLPLAAPQRNGTADPQGLTYTALPAYLADRLAQTGVTIRLYERDCELVRVPSDQGAELITWPPVQVKDRQQRPSHFSYVITFSVQTLVGNPQPRVHVHFGVRRWVSRPILEGGKVYLGTNARSVYLRTTEPWLGLSPGPMFTRARIRARYQEPADGGRPQRLPSWDGHIPDIAANRLDIAWPDSEELARNPLLYLNPPGKDGVVAAIVEQTPRYHLVQQGMGLDEHKRLTEIIAERLSDVLDLVPPLRRIDQITKSERHALEKNLRMLPPELRLGGLAASVGPQVTMEVWWQTDAWRNMVIDRIRALLERERPETPATGDTPDEEGDDPDDVLDDALAALQAAFALDDDAGVDFRDPGALEVPTEEDEAEQDAQGGAGQPAQPARRVARKKAVEEDPPDDVHADVPIPLPGGGRLLITPRPLGAIGAVFPERAFSSRRERAEYQRQQTQARITLIRTTVPAVTEPTLAFIELPNYQNPQKPQLRREFGFRDPKRAIRLGMAHAGRLTKFAEGDDPLRERATGAVLDGLRQLGYLPAPIGFKLPQRHAFPESLLVAGLWVCRLTQKRGFLRVHLPVVTLFHTQQQRVFLWLPDGKPVRPFSQGLLDITLMEPALVQRNNQREALRQLRQFLNQGIFQLGAEDVVVLAEAQNIRMTVTGLQNSAIRMNAFQLDKSEHDPPIDLRRGRMRVIRLRRSDRQETPEWYTAEATAGAGYVQGVWPEPSAQRTYYNIAAKPHTLKGGRYQGKQVNPSEYYAIPSILEILHVALQAQDDPDLWAYAVDQWRRMGYLTTDMTLMPMPLQWAEQVDRYAEVISPWVFPEQWGEEPLDEGDAGEDGSAIQLSLFD